MQKLYLKEKSTFKTENENEKKNMKTNKKK